MLAAMLLMAAASVPAGFGTFTVLGLLRCGWSARGGAAKLHGVPVVRLAQRRGRGTQVRSEECVGTAGTGGWRGAL